MTYENFLEEFLSKELLRKVFVNNLGPRRTLSCMWNMREC